MPINFFKRRECWRPTFWGWFLILFLLVIVFRIWLGTVSWYLSLNKPIKANTLVVEGWIEDEALSHAVAFYKANHYKNLIVTGLPITYREDLLKFKNTAESAVAQIKKIGFKDTIYQAVIPTNIYIDRTYNTAVVSRMIFEQHPDWDKSFNIYTVGVHSRRTYLMFRRAFGNNYRMGIISEKDNSFDAKLWWHTSKGFRNVSNEFVAFVYVWAFFHPNYELFKNNIEAGIRQGRFMEEKSDQDNP